ncbi:hypothetical protein [Novosphingobium sp.]|uniref:glycoside hydrolase family 16 protein n=1 Tax=Novosphingobium sp. TaxID=1874826 RepID=UPI00333FE7AD
MSLGHNHYRRYLRSGLRKHRNRARTFAALALLACLPAHAHTHTHTHTHTHAPHRTTVVWHDDFGGDQPRWTDWSRCAQPWEDKLSQCSALVSGSGEEVFWNPALLGGGRDPVVRGAEGGIMLLARPMTDTERALLDREMARQKDLQPRYRDALANARWTSAWMQTRPSFAIGTTVSAMIRPGAGASSWDGLWMLNDPAHRRWPPEIDVAEVTNEPDGRMHVRQVIHYRDETGQFRTAGCPIAVIPRDWITVSVTRLAGQIRFGLNGVERCRIPAPPGFGDPMNLILSEQVGGLAAHTDATTVPFGLEVRWVKVTRP